MIREAPFDNMAGISQFNIDDLVMVYSVRAPYEAYIRTIDHGNGLVRVVSNQNGSATLEAVPYQSLRKLVKFKPLEYWIQFTGSEANLHLTHTPGLPGRIVHVREVIEN